MQTSVIAAIGHVALQVRDLEAAVEHATTVMGLRVSDRSADHVDLTHGAPHHSLQYIRSDVDAVDHVGLEAAGPDALAEIRARLTAENIPLVSDGPLDECLPEGLAFETPAGFVLEVYTGMTQDQPTAYLASGVRPRRFGHVNFAVPDPQPMLWDEQGYKWYTVLDAAIAGARCTGATARRGPAPRVGGAAI
jgi:catechol 2,3-dioxygenase-like lactoylglutathione lyase family enzyme